MFAALRNRLGLYIAGTLVVGALAIALVAGYRFYRANLASTPEKAVSTYLDVLSKGDMSRLYELTLGSSGQSQAAFSSQLAALSEDKRLSTEGSIVVPIGRQGNAFYFQVTAKLRTGDGSYRLLPLILEATKEGVTWRVALYVPPSAVPAVAPAN